MNMRSALRLIPLMAIGAAAAFLLAGPLTSLYKSNAVAGRPQPSASGTIDPHASPTSCPASLPMPKTATTVTPPAAPALPFPVWVNEPLGAKVRAGASSSTAQLGILSQGTQATADLRAPDASGNVWYHVKQHLEPAQETVRVTAQQWAWVFQHAGPDGKLDTADDIRTIDELHVEKGKTYGFELVGRDVLHSFSVPVFRLLTLLESMHPHEPEHWYLAIAGVDPEWQGRGIGRKLLAKVII